MSMRHEVTVKVIMHTLLSRFLLLLLMILYFIPTVIFLLIPKSWREHRCWYWMLYIFYWLLLKVSLLPITIVQESNIPREPTVIVSNHQSSLDIPLIGSLLHGAPHVWLATYELMASPILRFIVPKIALLIDMRSPIAGMRSLISAIRSIKNDKKHAIIFPEAERFTDGNIHDFYMGFVILAKKTGRPVVPVRIFNLEKVYPRNSFWVFWHPVKAIVGPPMVIQGDESDVQFKDRVYAWFEQQGE